MTHLLYAVSEPSPSRQVRSNGLTAGLELKLPLEDSRLGFCHAIGHFAHYVKPHGTKVL